MTIQAGSQRREVYFSGRVQGVGFRYTTCSIARGFNVVGYVQNLADGRVRLVAEGAAAELDAFVAALEQQMEGHVAETKTDRRPATGEFASFSVRH